MKQFFSKIGLDHWTLHNKAQKQAREYVRELDRYVITQEEVDQFIDKIRKRIDEINEANPRCKDLNFWRSPDYDDTDDEALWIDGVVRMDLMEVKKPRNEIRTVDEVVPEMSLREAGELADRCDYAFAVQDVMSEDADAPEINTADAEQFFLAGYEEARKRLKEAKVLLQVIPELSNPQP